MENLSENLECYRANLAEPFSERIPVGIALGSNLGDRQAHLEDALTAIFSSPFLSGPVLRSSFWETIPVDCPPGSPYFLNAVVEIRISAEHDPLALLRWLKGLELRAGRELNAPRNSPRPLDLDLLYFGNETFASSELVLPHPRMATRRFVLLPLTEIRPNLRPPGWNKTVAEQLALLPTEDNARIVR